MTRIAAFAILLSAITALAGCVVEPAGPGYYDHPYYYNHPYYYYYDRDRYWR